MALITAAQLVRCNVGQDRAMILAPKLDAEAQRCEINTPRRIRHWIAQLLHESGNMNDPDLTENLSYSAERLCVVWPKRFPSLEAASPYARNPAALANKVYGGRMGNIQLGDGYRFIGRGLMMTTGRAGYGSASAWTGMDLVSQPELVAQPAIAAKVAADYWRINGLNEVADEDDGEGLYATYREAQFKNEEDDLRLLTLKINGGLTGLDDRRNCLLRTGAVWTD